MSEQVARAIADTMLANNAYEGAPGTNVTDALVQLSEMAYSIAHAITPQNASPATDSTGGHVGSLTEAVMGINAGLVAVAEAIERLAEATENR